MNVFAPPQSEELTSAIAQLQDWRLREPFTLLGLHETAVGWIIRCFVPGASAVRCRTVSSGATGTPMTQVSDGLFELSVPSPVRYGLQVCWNDQWIENADPYAFQSQLTDFDLHLIAEGRHFDLPERLGANPHRIGDVTGVLFAVWAPNAHNVSVVGDFNSWDRRRHPMQPQPRAGIWELFVPGLASGECYKFAIRAADGRILPLKADPMAKQTEVPPKTGSVVADRIDFAWTDADWLAERAVRQSRQAPISTYEVHLESWMRLPGHDTGSWDEAANRLIPYVTHLGFTHIELMPITEYPFGGSWGYQPLSLFAPTARLGDPAGFARFVDRCHAAKIGVILDWVAAHFPIDEHGMAGFDGTALYEHEDPRQGFHLDWNTLIYNVGRWEVRNFLINSAVWWLREFHVDGLRVDAVASMLYRDYSRPEGEWIPNHNGGRENLESVYFLQELNQIVRETVPGAIVIAEESTSWPGLTDEHGLGFQFKWNMGWMHDTLEFFSRDPIHRHFHLNDITFGLDYAFSEAFVLPLSHDEVVHGKGSLLSRMPGDDWQRFANLRLLFALMWTHPGKKLLFMGCEFGMEAEWDSDAPFPWPHPYDQKRQGLSLMVGDLNRLYRRLPQLHQFDTDQRGFTWIIADDRETTLFAFRRSNGDWTQDAVIVLNATPVPRYDVQVGVTVGGDWIEVFNSDAQRYGGSDIGNAGRTTARSEPAHDQGQSLRLTVPPLGLVVLVPAAGMPIDD